MEMGKWEMGKWEMGNGKWKWAHKTLTRIGIESSSIFTLSLSFLSPALLCRPIISIPRDITLTF